MTEPLSALTQERPLLWQRTLDLAMTLTGYIYAPKLPLSDGTVYACGGYVPWDPPPPARPPSEREKVERQIEDCEREIEENGNRPCSQIDFYREEKARLEKLLAGLKKKLAELNATPIVWVPEGAFDWLLHEVGHWIAATPEERALPNYGLGSEEHGHGADREWQAWAFEEIVMFPFGSARELTPPSYRGGVGYSKAGPIPRAALDHIGQRLQGLCLDIEPWRLLAAEWIRWGRSRGIGRAPWEMGD